MNYYRRFPGDYLRDTMGLTLLQHGAYTLLLDYLYATERRVADEQQAFSICRAGTQEEQWAVSEILRNFFKKTTTGFTNKRFEREAKLRKDWCKRQKTKRDRLRDISVTVTPESRLSPSPSPSPSKEKEREEKKPSPPPRLTEVEVFGRKSFDRFWSAYPNQIDRDVCFRLWLALSPIDQDKAADSVPVWANSEGWSEPRFIPKPETFLLRRRWESLPKLPVNLADRKKELEAKFESAGH